MRGDVYQEDAVRIYLDITQLKILREAVSAAKCSHSSSFIASRCGYHSLTAILKKVEDAISKQAKS